MRRFPFASLEPWNGVLPMPIKVKFAWPDLFASGMFAKKTVGEFYPGAMRSPPSVAAHSPSSA